MDLEEALKIEKLLDRLIYYWGDYNWSSQKKFYLNELIPAIIENIDLSGATEKEREVLRALQNKLSDSEWKELGSILGNRFELHPAEKAAYKEDVQRSTEIAAQEIADKLQREKEELVARGELQRLFSSCFLEADGIYQNTFSDLVSAEWYRENKIRFVRSWLREISEFNADSEQAEVISSYGADVQVVARAGSGKTSILVNRAIFFIKHCGVSPQEIMLLAFNRKACEEISARLERVLGNNIPHVMTFHALAYAIVHPEEQLLYDDTDGENLSKNGSIQSMIDDFRNDEFYAGKIRELMLEHFRADWSKIVFGGYDKSKEEFLELKRGLPDISLRGEYVKSYGEKLIANFLFEHDIDY